MQWISIDDRMPEDFQRVDLWCKRSWEPPELHERRTNVYWDKWHKTWRTVGNEHYIENTFKCLDNIYDYRYLIPTHWMPIPQPPY